MKEKEVIVIKVGTNVLTANGEKLNRKIIKYIVSQVVELLRQGYQIILVTSGAVAAGKEVVSLSKIKEIIKRQIYAAIGQARLMHEYEQLFRSSQVQVGQALLTRQDFCDRTLYDNVLHTLEGLLANNIVPIINENDVTTTHELSFGDNDVLAANAAVALDASKLILLTNQDGLMTANPDVKNSGTKLIKEVTDVKEVLSFVSQDAASTGGIGGMFSKVKAAQIAMSAGITVWIINGLNPKNIQAVVKGENEGTKFIPQKITLAAKDRWILCAKNANAGIIIDDGAVLALKKRKSLLMVGVRKVLGSFKEKEIIEVVDQKKRTIGYGVVNYSSMKITEALKTPQILKREVIHTNNLKLI